MTVEGEQVKTAPPEKSAITTLTDAFKKLASGYIKHSPSAEADITLRDTLRIIETDTIYIPYGVKVTDNGKDKSFLPRFSELAKVAFLVVTAALALWVALRNKA